MIKEETMSEIIPFTREDFEAAIEASGWNRKNIEYFFVSDEQFSELPKNLLRITFVKHRGKTITTNPNKIVLIDTDDNRFIWQRPIPRPFKVGGNVVIFNFNSAYKNRIGEIVDFSRTTDKAFVKWPDGNVYEYYLINLKHAPIEEKPKEIQYEYTHSAILQDKDGNEIIIPDPDSSWEIVEEQKDFWPYKFIDKESETIKKLIVNHEIGQMIIHEYKHRFEHKSVRLISYKKFRRPIQDPIVEEIPQYSGSPILKTLSIEPVQECVWPTGGRPRGKIK